MSWAWNLTLWNPIYITAKIFNDGLYKITFNGKKLRDKY